MSALQLPSQTYRELLRSRGPADIFSSISLACPNPRGGPSSHVPPYHPPYSDWNEHETPPHLESQPQHQKYLASLRCRSVVMTCCLNLLVWITIPELNPCESRIGLPASIRRTICHHPLPSGPPPRRASHTKQQTPPACLSPRCAPNRCRKLREIRKGSSPRQSGRVPRQISPPSP